MLTPGSPSNKVCFNLSNISLGFATNSSSTHSVVINPERYESMEFPLELEARERAGVAGSENYKITDSNHRLVLFANALYENLKSEIGTQAAKSVVCEFCCIDPDTLKRFSVEDRLKFAIPTKTVGSAFKPENDPETFCEAYLRDLMNFLVSNKSVGVIRQYDPDSDKDIQNRLTDGGASSFAKSSDIREQWVARADGKWWVLMNRRTGAKVRVNFSDIGSVYTKSTYPELVDIKITDYCPYNCSFCYQGSTPEGKHAKTADVYQYVYALSDMGVFEVAIGGGEPTLHPDFKKIINAFYRSNIQTNFTTRNLTAFNNPEFAEAVYECNAKFAVSVDTLEAAKKAISTLKALRLKDDVVGKNRFWQKRPYTLQVILGTDPKAVCDILDHANEQTVDCTLLGYKTTGRGAIDLKVNGTTLKALQNQYKKTFADVIESKIGKGFSISIGIDTLGIKQLPFLLAEKYSYFVTPKEGAFSMYIDAVANSMGRSSYEEPDQFKGTDIDHFFKSVRRAEYDGPEVHELLKKQISEAYANWT